MVSVYKRKNRQGKKVAEYTALWFDAETDKWRHTVAFTDKEVSLALARKLETEAAERKLGLANPTDEHLARPAAEHLTDYLSNLRSRNREDLYVEQVEFRIQRIIDGLKIDRLYRLEPLAVQQFLAQLRYKGRSLGGITQNEYINSIKSLTKWAKQNKRLNDDPLEALGRIEKKKIQPMHPRRALGLEDLGCLLEATERRPEVEVRLCRRGPNAGKPVNKVRPWVIENMRQLGQERRLAYEIAILTGLRRSEIAALTWGDLHLDAIPPHIQLRAEVTKSRRADRIVLPPQIVERLQAMRPANTKGNTPVVETVPDMKTLKADLKMAGIDYGDREVGYADLHALRKTYNTLMAGAGMSLAVRQVQMRHADPRLTQSVYIDEALLPIADELANLPRIGLAQHPAGAAMSEEMVREAQARKAEARYISATNSRPERTNEGKSGQEMASNDFTSGNGEGEQQVLKTA